MWGRLATCGGLAIRLSGDIEQCGRRVINPPQVANLPHMGTQTLTQCNFGSYQFFPWQALR